MIILTLVAGVLALGALPVRPAQAAPTRVAQAAPTRVVQAPSAHPATSQSQTVWLCRPGTKPDPCFGSLADTELAPSGKTKIVNFKIKSNRPIDCFYVYPTVSFEKTINANLKIQSAEIGVATMQASRFSQYCKVYAPMYPQLTLRGIFSPKTTPQDEQTAYQGVLIAWKDYMNKYNKGRGVVLIGHSQGAFMLEQLLRNYIQKNKSEMTRIVSAIILGGDVEVPKPGVRDAAGTLTKIAPCRSSRQIGCVIAYSSFNYPPPQDSKFGRVPGDTSQNSNSKLQILCTNPGDLGSSKVAALSYYGLASATGLSGGKKIKASTRWVSYPGLFTGQCENKDGAQWLQIDEKFAHSQVEPSLVDSVGPSWGLHLLDVNIAYGNLVNIVGDESAAYQARHR